MRIGLFWFQQDLRLRDNPAFRELNAAVDRLICVAFADPDAAVLRHRFPQYQPPGRARRQFWQQSLAALDRLLQSHGQQLLVLQGSPLEALPAVVARYGVTHMMRSDSPGLDETWHWHALQQRCKGVEFNQRETATLFHYDDFAFDETAFPATFSQFRRQLSGTQLEAPEAATTAIMPMPGPMSRHQWHVVATVDSAFEGGESAALSHLSEYMGSAAPGCYKDTRNALSGWENSTKFSPWLASGCISARAIMAAVAEYEARHGSNDSTQWIGVELLWREYFHHYARHHRHSLFAFDGLSNQKPLTSFYPGRFRAWCEGKTPWPLVNACMRELSATGYMSNRGRQIVASCLVNELGIDWRFGAAYFQAMLLDFDVFVNWGNWQYIAGVGADPRGGRHFNIAKQTETYDPDGIFIAAWQGDSGAEPLIETDYHGWPVLDD